jgi:hypothetical protein
MYGPHHLFAGEAERSADARRRVIGPHRSDAPISLDQFRRAPRISQRFPVAIRQAEPLTPVRDSLLVDVERSPDLLTRRQRCPHRAEPGIAGALCGGEDHAAPALRAARCASLESQGQPAAIACCKHQRRSGTPRTGRYQSHPATGSVPGAITTAGAPHEQVMPRPPRSYRRAIVKNT